jgi:hypothetical protein
MQTMQLMPLLKSYIRITVNKYIHVPEISYAVLETCILDNTFK